MARPDPPTRAGSPTEVGELAPAYGAGPSEPDPRAAGGRNGWKAVGVVLALLVAVAVLHRAGGQVAVIVITFAEWVEGLGPWGPAALIIGYVVGTVAMVPGSFLTIAAGAVFGAALGGLYVFIGATLGGSASFLIARYLARATVERRFSEDRRFAAIDRAVADDGRRIVFLLRLSPLFPFNLLNYLLGLTRIRFLDYFLASAGMIPGIALYVYAGHVAGDLARVAAGAEIPRGPSYYALLGLGLVATLLVTLLIAHRARRALQEASG
jgi:uncharacterized membrane protein YdjX (TVP38/TMEM64 family)